MMNCPSCGLVMVWLNGSVLHDPPVNHYECRRCQIYVIKQHDGSYEMKAIQPEEKSAIVPDERPMES
ncbi:MAG: hypothetical protein ACREA4_10465 [Nitrososphaera sp.]